MNHKLAIGIKVWEGNATTFLFPWKESNFTSWKKSKSEKTMATEHFNGILFHKSGPVKQHTNQSIIWHTNSVWVWVEEQQKLVEGYCLTDYINMNRRMTMPVRLEVRCHFHCCHPHLERKNRTALIDKPHNFPVLYNCLTVILNWQLEMFNKTKLNPIFFTIS